MFDHRVLKRSTTVLPVAALSVALVAVVWLAVLAQIESDRRTEQQGLFQDTANIALAFEQNAARTASEIDLIIKFLRRTHERAEFGSDWPSLIKDEYTVNDQTVQIAIIDANGMMITSTAMLYPSKPVDLSDREHYRVHTRNDRDELFISKPLVGRASGKWSVQFTRRFIDADGAFAGVIVVSLDPAQFARSYAGLNLGPTGGVALAGNDDVIRAGTGVYATALGRGLRFSEGEEVPESPLSGTNLFLSKVDGRDVTVAIRPVKSYPLNVIVTRQAAQQDAELLSRRGKYLAGALGFTALVTLGLFSHLRSQRRHEAELRHLLRHDPLTGLANRRALTETLNKHIMAGRHFALLLVDLDNFKLANDTYGHGVGDQLLQDVARRLEALAEPDVLCARLGGDELAVVQGPIKNVHVAEQLATRICKLLSEPYEIDSARIFIGASVGIALGASDHTATEIMKAADIALYEAKAERRGGYRVYDEALNAARLARRLLEIELAHALEGNQLELHYQPIVDLRSKRIAAFEALVRWRHPRRGLIPPSEFINVAEESGLIVPIGRWVVRKACQDIAGLPGQVRVAVNVSPAQIAAAGLASTVREAYVLADLAPDRLEIEITETMLMHPNGGVLNELRECGVRIALDDFGTGYSSLSYLQTYPIDSIKIDSSFIARLGRDNTASAIVEAIISLALKLGIPTVGEGIERTDQLDALEALGCLKGQGFLLGRPTDIQAAARLLASTSRAVA
jgi:diguanylate cyclase (GGDEF)-like protein